MELKEIKGTGHNVIDKVKKDQEGVQPAIFSTLLP